MLAKNYYVETCEWFHIPYSPENTVDYLKLTVYQFLVRVQDRIINDNVDAMNLDQLHVLANYYGVNIVTHEDANTVFFRILILQTEMNAMKLSSTNMNGIYWANLNGDMNDDAIPGAILVTAYEFIKNKK